MNTRSQIVCAWCGYLCPIFMFAGLWPAAGFFPPTAPTVGAQDIAALYQANLTGIRVSSILFIIAGALFGAFAASIAAQMRRMETRATPVLTYGQLAGSLRARYAKYVYSDSLRMSPVDSGERNLELTALLREWRLNRAYLRRVIVFRISDEGFDPGDIRFFDASAAAALRPRIRIQYVPSASRLIP